MWVFGYGSLMWANWCDDLSCESRKIGVLPGYRRTFNKASTRNWGTKDNPCPTLNLVRDPKSHCKGVVFKFPDVDRKSVIARLKAREGKGFTFEQLPIRLSLSTTVSAIVPLYSGKNTIQNKSREEIIEMVLNASGQCGNCLDYLLNLHQHMQRLEISDPTIEEFTARVRSRIKDSQQRGRA